MSHTAQAATIIDGFTEPVFNRRCQDATNDATAENVREHHVLAGPHASIIGSYRDLKADALSGAQYDPRLGRRRPARITDTDVGDLL